MKTERVLVSVVVPVYNTKPYLLQCLDSLAGQTLEQIEVICVDDGSTDGSAEVLDTYSRQDSRFCVMHQENGGPGIARNIGLERARGDFLLFFDSDDWAEPEFLQRMYERIRETGADICICRADEFDTKSGRFSSGDWMLKKKYLPSGSFSPEQIAPYLFQFTYGMPWDKLYRRTFIQENNLSFPALKNSEDLAFVFPSILAAQQISVVDQIFIHHRINRMSSVSNLRVASPDDPFTAFQIVKNFLMQHNMYERYGKSFLNWGLEFVVWHVSNMSDAQVQKRYLEKLKTQWVPKLGFHEYPRTYFRSRMQLAKLYLALYLPAPCFRMIVLAYKWAKEILIFPKNILSAFRRSSCIL